MMAMDDAPPPSLPPPPPPETDARWQDVPPPSAAPQPSLPSPLAPSAPIPRASRVAPHTRVSLVNPHELSSVEELRRHVERLQRQVRQDEADIAELTHQLALGDQDVMNLMNQNSILSSDLEHERAHARSLADENVRLQDHVAALNSELRTLKAAKNSDSERISAAKIRSLEAELEKARKTEEELLKLNAAQELKLEKAVTFIKHHREGSQGAQGDSNKAISELKAELAKVTRERDELLPLKDEVAQLKRILNKHAEERRMLDKSAALERRSFRKSVVMKKEAQPDVPTSAEEELALAQEQIRKLVAAIKQDRAERQKEINELINERDEEAARAAKIEAKMMQVIDLLKKEREERKFTTTAGMNGDAVSVALKQIEEANRNAAKAQELLSQREEELEKVKSLARSKIRDLQACEEELKAQQAKAEQLLELARKYKLEIATLRNGGFVSSSISADAMEVIDLKEKTFRLEQGVRKLKQLLTDTKAEAEETEARLLDRLNKAEERAEKAELRMRDAIAAALTRAPQAPPTSSPAHSAPMATPTGAPLPPSGGPSPPPPPPPPPVRVSNGALKITKTGQSGAVSQGPSKQDMLITDIVTAIKKGVNLKKTGGTKGIEQRKQAEYKIERVEVASSSPADEIDEAEALADLAKDIERNKALRQQRAKEQMHEPPHKPGKELDNLLAQLEGLDDL